MHESFIGIQSYLLPVNIFQFFIMLAAPMLLAFFALTVMNLKASKKLVVLILSALFGVSVFAADLSTEISSYEYQELLKDINRVDEAKIAPLLSTALKDGVITTQERNIIKSQAKKLLKEQELVDRSVDAKLLLQEKYS